MKSHNDNGYLLIFRGTDWYQGLSPEQMQQVMDQWMNWFHRLQQEGRCAGGNPLEPQGKIVAGHNGVITDGPFAEAKETVGGYFLLTVPTMDEAVAIARECPGLPHGIRVEVRAIAPACPIGAELRSDARLAHA